jgi:hypothetical protein
MCDFEDIEIISVYTREQAVADGVLVPLFRYQGKPVVATSHIYGETALVDLVRVFREFDAWDKYDRPQLKEEDQLFHMNMNGKKVWVIDDGEAFTIMYPEDY